MRGHYGGCVPSIEPGLDKLIARAEAGVWDPARDIDWSDGPVRPALIPSPLYRMLISQLYHGERAVLAMCERLSGEISDAGARRFLATQADDEARHAEAYARYLDRIGGIGPVDPALRRTFEAALDWDGPWQGLMVAGHLLLESEAVRLLRRSPRMFSCPLLREINARVARDEARHLAFGRLYLRLHLGRLSRSERQRIHRWVHGLWRESVYAWRGPLTVLAWVNHRALRKLWRGHEAELRAVGLIEPGAA